MKTLNLQNGGTTLGVIIGVLLGLAVALVVSLYIAYSGAPVQTKATHTAPKIEAPNDPSKAPDPNQSLYTKVPKTDDSKDAKDGKDGKDAKDGKDQAANGTVSTGASKTDSDAIGKIAALVTPAPAAESITMPKSASAASGAERYFVQAGAYANLAEAEAIKAKLALQGVTMSLSAREKDGQTLQRVRTVPLAAADAERLRNTLKANGVETSLVKVQ